ncbi:MAG: hypothetical protein H0U57_04455 [Tatlockia sp.]|nr:hypothetical protein [Tatlockia sp.]
MKLTGRLTIPILLLFIINSANAVPSLMFSGKPVDPLCFSNLESNLNTIDLKTCGIKKEKYRVTGQDEDLIKKGYVGFNWKDSSSDSQGMSYYKVFSAGANQFWAYTLNNSGGSGEFTSLKLVKQKNPQALEIKTLMGGDRCNGGVQDVVENNNQLRFSVNLTAADFLTLVDKNPHQLKAFDDLSACAVCCSATAIYEADSSSGEKLSYVDLGQDADIANMPNQGKYQECFNKLLASYISKKITKLEPQKLTDFVNQFNEECINS